MSIQYKIDFEKLTWQSPLEGIKQKTIEQNNIKLRLVEFSKEMPAHWCEKGHYGYLIEGSMQVEFPNETIIFNPGDGIFIPDGPEHKHNSKLLTDKVKIFFVENI